VSLLVTGSVAIDRVKTPHGVSEECLGGSAVYFTMAASFFGPVRFVGVVGADCPFDFEKIFAGRNVDLAGLEIRKNSKTFRWHGTYQENMDERTTDYLELNVLSEPPPKIPRSFRDSKFVFLANTTPRLQIELLEQLTRPKFVGADTMNHWIEGYPGDLKNLLKKIHCLIINEDEARLLGKDYNLIKASQNIIDMGVGVLIIKKGQSGSMTYTKHKELFLLPAYPTAQVKDPTGAGDSFAGGLMGYLAATGKTDFATLKKAVVYGTVVASFAIADFSLNGLTAINRADIDNRLETLRSLTQF